MSEDVANFWKPPILWIMRGVDILSSWVGVTLAELFWVCEMTYGDDLEAADAMRAANMEDIDMRVILSVFR